MNDEIKVGEYVRTKHYGIFKVLGIFKEHKTLMYIKKPGETVEITDKYEMTKHSPNIIDLVERDDYVNGERVIGIDYKEFEDHRKIYFELHSHYCNKFNVGTIVTKEQFEKIMYRVEE